MCINNSGKWIKLPPGNPKNPNVIASTPPPVVHTSCTILRYPQGNLKTCMIGSFASCLHYIGVHENKIDLSQKADAIMRNLGDIFKAQDFYNKFCHIVTHHCKDKYLLIRNKTFRFDQEEQEFDMPTLVVLVGNDHAPDHAITVYKRMIFDTSHETVLERCLQTLNWCCGPKGYKRIYRAYSLKEKNQKSKNTQITNTC